MKLLVILGFLLGAVVAFGSPAASNDPKESPAITQKVKRLGLSIVTDRQKYKPRSKIKITAMLANADDLRDIFVYGTLGWGHLSSLTYTIRDASGKRVQPTILADDLTLPIPRNDTTLFVRLPPNHFLGTNYIEELDRLNLKKPGKYSILVEYHCPISTASVDLSNFWSKEDGTVRSNMVWIEVIP